MNVSSGPNAWVLSERLATGEKEVSVAKLAEKARWLERNGKQDEAKQILAARPRSTSPGVPLVDALAAELGERARRSAAPRSCRRARRAAAAAQSASPARLPAPQRLDASAARSAGHGASTTSGRAARGVRDLEPGRVERRPREERRRRPGPRSGPGVAVVRVEREREARRREVDADLVGAPGLRAAPRRARAARPPTRARGKRSSEADDRRGTPSPRGSPGRAGRIRPRRAGARARSMRRSGGGAPRTSAR